MIILVAEGTSSFNCPNDSYSLTYYLNISSYDVCAENTLFIDKRIAKGDNSVTYNQYVSMNMTDFESKVTLPTEEYNGQSPEGQAVTIPEKRVITVEGNLKAALSTPLADLSTYTKDHYYYVVYAAIDLMNYHYTKNDKNNKVVLCFSMLLIVVVFLCGAGD